MIRQSLTSWAGVAVVAGMFGAALLNACSADSRGHSFGSGDGTGGAGAGDVTVGSGFSTSSGDITVGSGTSGGVGGGCASSSVKAELIPLDLFVMFDQSGSMSDPAGGGTKWDVVTQAMTDFLLQPGTDGIGVGIQYFGLSAGGMACAASCTTDADCPGACGPCFPGMGFPGSICFGSAGAGDSCNAADYAKAEVEIAPLPGVAQPIIDSMAKHGPSTGTPTHPALDGAIQHATTWNKAHVDHVVVVVFVTDGVPSGCDEDLNHINALAAAGQANGILTYVIGVGDALSSLNGIAAAGGTGQAFLVDANANAGQQFLDAMNAIRGTSLACSYKIPVPAMGMADFDSVNVQYTPGDGSMPVLFPKVKDKASCPAGGNAWYYDNNVGPTQIILCDETCTTVKKDDKGQVDIVLGCATIVN